jgi:outer membrane protein assembly factor BamB
LWWLALLVVLLNDHVLQGAGVLPGALTGKLSDVAGLVLVPALVASLARARSRSALQRPVLASALALGSLACLGCSSWPVAKPTVVNNRVFVEHHEGALFVLDATSGAVRTALVSTGANASAPAIADHILYAVDERNRLTGIDVDNPMQPFVLWQPSDHNARLSLHHVDRHRVYAFVRSDERSLIAIDRSFGQVLWTLPIETGWLPEIRAAGDLLLIADEQALLAVGARSGSVVWRFQATADVGTPDVDGQIVYVAGSDGVYSGLDVRTGTPVWRFVSGEATCGQSSPVALVDRGVLVGCFGGELHGIAIATSSVTWTASRKLGAYEEGIVVARADDNQLIGLDGPTGRELWRTELDDDLCTEPVVAAGAAFVRNHVGKIYAVELRTGALRWQVDMGEKVEARVVGDKLLVVRRTP